MADIITVAKELKTIKADIDKIKAENAKLEGRKEQLLMTLKTTYGLDTVEQAKDKLVDIQKDYDLTNADAMEIYKQIKGLYEKMKSGNI